MTNHTPGPLLLVAIAVIGLALFIPVISAHGNDTGTDVPPYDGTPEDWTNWMETHMTAHMGPGSVEWMESHMGVTVEEMGQDMADDGTMNGYGHC